MKTYIATVRIHGRLVRTRVWADDPVHARLLLQYFFGMSSVAAGPVLGEGDHSNLPDAEQLRLAETGIKPIKPIKAITPSKPRTPGQAQIAALKTRIDQAKQALQAERQRQKMIKAQQTLHAAMKPVPPK